MQRQESDGAKMPSSACVGLLKHWLAPGVMGVVVVRVLGVHGLGQHRIVLAVLASNHGRAVVGADAGGDH